MEYQKLLQIRKQKGIEIAQRKKITNHAGIWLVPSQSNPKQVYKVQLSLNGSTCTCQDYQKRAIRCKHIFAVDVTITKQIDEKGNTIITTTKRIRYPQRWHEYTEAQNNEGRLFKTLLKELVENIPERPYTFGRPSVSIKTSLFCAIDKVYCMQSSRRAHSRYEDAETKEQIDKAPNYNHINKSLNKPEMTPILRDLLYITAMPLKSIETKFAPDSTGFRTSRFSDYCEKKHNTKREHKWIKAHLMTGTKTNIITDAVVAEQESADCPQLEPMLETRVEMGFEPEQVSADKAYSSRDNMECINRVGAVPYIPFGSNATGKAKGSVMWKKAFHFFQLNQEEFLMGYHDRSNIESTVMAVKSKMGDSVKSRNFVAQVDEVYCKLIAYNITVLISAMYELKIEPKLLSISSE